MLLAELASTSQRVAQTSKRKQKLEYLAECLEKIPPEEITAGAHYLAGELRQGRIGVGYAAIRDSYEIPAATEATLAIAEIDATLTEIAAATGAGSAKKRSELLGRMFARATQAEQELLRGLLGGAIRQGALESLVIDAIARAAGVAPAVVRRAQMVAADLGAVAKAALYEGEIGLSRFALTLFAPVQPMLAQTAETVDEALDRFQSEAAFELKLDGARVQVHKSGDEVRVYSRGLNEVTARVPELVESVAALPARELILDGETIALTADGSPLPFQLTMRRYGRKSEVEMMRGELPLRTFFFDCLRIDADTLLGSPARARIEALDRLLPAEHRVERLITGDRAQAKAFLDKALERGHEGVMAKSLDAAYEAGSRGASWLKLKTAHTLDLVVLAVEQGSGRREGWLSNIHLGARDEASGQFVMLGKTFKGMTDEMLEWQTKKFLELETHREGHVVYLRHELVVEIAFSDVLSSPHYPAGLALRFARVKRYRPDKKAEEADTLARVRSLTSTLLLDRDAGEIDGDGA